MPLDDQDYVPTNRRHWLHAIWLQIVIRVVYFFDQWAGAKLFLGISAYKSKFRPKNAPTYDIITRLGFLFIWISAGVARDGFSILYFIGCKVGFFTLCNKLHTWLTKRLEAQFKATGYTSAQREMPIPEYDWKNGTPEEFYRLFAHPTVHPVVLRGFMKDSELVKTFTWKNLMDKYGEEEVYLTKKQLDGYPGKLKDVEDPKIYLHNSEKLFNKYPEIRKLFEYERLEDYLKMKIGYEQLFVGKQGTGTPFHNAANWNMFYMIHGNKRWWFIDPYDTFLAYPISVVGKAAGVIACLWPNEYNEQAFPLFKYCPVYTAELEPGDVLFNPPWWWHAIKNTTSHTIGVASRWHTDGIVGHKGMMSEEDYNIYRFGSFMFLHGLNSFKFLHGILQEPSPKYDEHATLRETNNRFVHKQIEISEKGGIDVVGVKTPY